SRARPTPRPPGGAGRGTDGRGSHTRAWAHLRVLGTPPSPVLLRAGVFAVLVQLSCEGERSGARGQRCGQLGVNARRSPAGGDQRPASPRQSTRAAAKRKCEGRIDGTPAAAHDRAG